MNAVETLVNAHPATPEINLTSPQDRRADVDGKQLRIAELLKEVGCDGLLLLAQENFAWFTAGGTARGTLDAEALPALYINADGRWLICSNVDSQRLFDEEIDGLGFQLKEWPWHWGRHQLLADLCQGRNVACDEPCGSCKPIPDQIRKLRRSLTSYEEACYRALGQILSHALEATGRTLAQGETEREVAGQLSHRLLHRGATPHTLTVAADGRSRFYRQGGFTATPITGYCVISATTRKYGLYACASRSISFGDAEANFRREHDVACRVSATYVAGSWPDSVPRQILASGQRIYQISDMDHEWALCPQGHLIGRAPLEKLLLPRDEELLQSHSAVTWLASVGAALSCDTFLITDDGPRGVTAAENWPLKRIRIQGAEFVRPDILIR